MSSLNILLLIIQCIMILVCFFKIPKEEFKSSAEKKTVDCHEFQDELEKIQLLRNIELSQPLSEKTRPQALTEVIGQTKGIKALKAALFGENPQHVIIYGPPGVGKTAAARIVLEEAKRSKNSPFQAESKFVEMDATTMQFDERSIADPLIGSVHDPIYQGAGAYGPAGVPQPKIGAVTKAHGGILFIDEIGELPSIQINKLLKVLEDRKVFLNSAYYSADNPEIPHHIHDIFKHGLPADFRLIGATTRMPEEIPAAVRSRCTEIFFHHLKEEDLITIAKNAFQKTGIFFENNCCELIASYSHNGREAVNIIETACSIVKMEERNTVTIEDIEWVLEFGKIAPKIKPSIEFHRTPGFVNGLAVHSCQGFLLKIETQAKQATKQGGSFVITGIAEEEEVRSFYSKIRRTSSAKASALNVLSIIENYTTQKLSDYHIHVNFPGGIPVDGPSAGCAIFTSIFSALHQLPVNHQLAMTGEISVKGKVLPVGGVHAKIEAALEAGINKIIIPKANYQKIFDQFDAQIYPVDRIEDIITLVFPSFISQNSETRSM